MNKKIKLVLVLLAIVLIIGCITFLNKNQNDEIVLKNIEISIYDEEEFLIYDKEKRTDKTFLIDVLKSLDDLSVDTETGAYGEYIVSINNKSQGNNYYWNYYINGEYASVGVSNCEIKENDIYTFKLEKFE